MRTRFYTVEQLGEKRALTPEGFLVCYDVPIARTGEMSYAAGEIPLDAGPGGIIRVTRDEQEVFREAHIISYVGKAVVDDHPSDEGGVGPHNWRLLSRGSVLSPRRGSGILADCLVADLIICDKEAIEKALDGKLEVSCGYDADYEATGHGTGRQTNLIGNHVALVDAGRCGPRCAIGDRRKTQTGDKTMSTCDKKPNFLDRIKAALSTKDDKLVSAAIAAAESELAEVTPGGQGDVHIHVGGAGATKDELPDDPDKQFRDGLESRFGVLESGHAEMKDTYGRIRDDLEAIKGQLGMGAADSEANKEIEGELKEEAPVGTNDAAIKSGTKDSVLLSDSFQEAVAGAEILMPGMAVPTFDSKALPKKTLDSICGLRRKALELSYATTDGKMTIDALTGGATPDFKTIDCKAERQLFRAAVALKKAQNNSTQDTKTVVVVKDDKNKVQPIRSTAELNKRLRDHYGADKS